MAGQMNFGLLDTSLPYKATMGTMQAYDQSVSNQLANQQARDTNAMNALKLSEAQRTADADIAMKSELPKHGGGIEKTANALISKGFMKEGTALLKQAGDQRLQTANITKTEGEIKKQKYEAAAQAYRDMSGNPSNENITAYMQDALLKKEIDEPTAQRVLSQILAMDANGRKQFLSMQGAKAADLARQQQLEQGLTEIKLADGTFVTVPKAQGVNALTQLSGGQQSAAPATNMMMPQAATAPATGAIPMPTPPTGPYTGAIPPGIGLTPQAGTTQAAPQQAGAIPMVMGSGKPSAAQQAASKPLPTAALKMQQDGLNAIATSSTIQSDLGAIVKQLESGTLDLGPIKNVIANARNAAGMSTPESKNLATFNATLEKLRNDSLRLNKGVQTDNDAKNAWNELVKNINDPGVVKQRLEEIIELNRRAVELRKNDIDAIRSNYGHAPLDVTQYQNQPAAVGGQGAAATSSNGWTVTVRK